MFNIQVSASAHQSFPMEIIEGYFKTLEKQVIHIPLKFPFENGWGETSSYYIGLDEEYLMPSELYLKWFSIVENRFYAIETKLPYLSMALFWSQNDKQLKLTHIVLGIAPKGDVILWFKGELKSIYLGNIKGNSYIGELSKEFDDYYKNYIARKKISYQTKCSIDLISKYMQQFTYRYLLFGGKWNDDEEIRWQKYKDEEIQPEFDYIEESLIDGTFDKLHDNGLLKYHNAGKPKKIAIKWHINKSEYTAYFWFDDEKTCLIFERFYGAHPDTKTDFIIRIDTENKKYELSLYRQGLKEPQIISEDAYQLLVFKNKFEDYRSDNYNQERGAWIW